MKYRVDVRISNQLLESSDVTDETIKRDLMKKLVGSIPMEYAEQIFKFTIFDPEKMDEIDLLTNELFQKLKRSETIMYIADIEVNQT